jgi:hypothetical protein
MVETMIHRAMPHAMIGSKTLYPVTHVGDISKPNGSIVPAGLIKQLRHAPIGCGSSDPDDYGDCSLDRNGVEKSLDRLP